jgi:UDP-N-acetylmuramyl tripeptide synthase
VRRCGVPLPLRTRFAALAGRAVAEVSRRAGRGGGSVIGGRVLLAIDPHALDVLAAGRTSVLVSGTNGKTTTTRLLAAGVGAGGAVVTNGQGANLLSGLVTTLSSAPAGATAVLEVDEGLLPAAIESMRPRAVTLLNLSRDQLDRIGEVRTHAKRWRDALEGAPDTVAIANADDPLVVWAAHGAGTTTWVGTGQRWRLDAASCPQCGGRITWAGDEPGAHWSCSSCDLARPEPAWSLDVDDLVAPGGRRMPISLQLPGWANKANATMAAAAAALIGVDPVDALRAMSSVGDVAGRYQVIDVDGVPVRLLLAKNPAGWSEALDLLRPAPVPVVVGINARVADGRDPSWLWDVPFERMAGRFVVATGERGRDLAVRLRYAGVDHEYVAGYRDAVRVAAAHGGEPAVDLAANYTSFQQARKELEP